MSNDFKKQVVGREEWLRRLPEIDRKLYAMYSSVADCIVTDQSIMTVPIDDHMVHRGDGIFESFKCLDGRIYNLGAHLDRLQRSCEILGIDMPVPHDEMADIVVQTLLAAGQRNALVRLLVSRGQGTMGVNPYACLRSELYIVVYELQQTNIDQIPDGVSMAISKIPIKPGMFAQVKTCNYLPNVL
ncbi:MAG: aminotransferase class IV, partial [Kiritimatiellaceae bacterium]|nr:aminotransferase class IV [Kiritimatiellaceae bacterium]